jgi:hypothetical protein
MSYRTGLSNGGDDVVTIRRALPGDAAALARLAVLDDAPPLTGEKLVAEVDGELWAAFGLPDARTISDPFRPTAEARALLELRARLIGRAVATRNPARGWRRLLATLG